MGNILTIVSSSLHLWLEYRYSSTYDRSFNDCSKLRRTYDLDPKFQQSSPFCGHVTERAQQHGCIYGDFQRPSVM